MSVATEKVVGVTPAENADQMQGRRRTQSLSAFQAVVATAQIGQPLIVDRPGRIRGLAVKSLTSGSAGQTDVDLLKIPAGSTTPATVFSAPAVIDNADADGTYLFHRDFAADPAGLVEAGDILYIEVTAAPTGGADLFVEAYIDERFDPPAERPLLAP